jgi:hypothetical protein
MIRNSFLLVSVLITYMAVGQVTDDFSDGDFSQNPTWTGDSEKFVVEQQILRLHDNQAATAYLATNNNIIDHTQWEFWVRLAFTPSNNNHPIIYLVSDNPDLSAPLNGYYIRIGKDGTDNKRIYFYRQTGDTHTEIMTGNTNIASSNNNILRIKVVRDNLGNWDFFADPTGNILYDHQGTVADNHHTSTQWFGIRCNYTVSNSSNFFFDDFYVGPILIDSIPPQLTFAEPVTQNSLELTFTEPIEKESAERIYNYFVNNGIGAPVSAFRPEATPNKVILSFASSFVSAETYKLSVANIKDLSANIMENTMKTFFWYVPQMFDVVFNELMVNPTPAIALPPHEYIELFNTSSFDIDLQGWTLQHGSTQRQLPQVIIPANEYLILTHSLALDEFATIGNVVVVPGLSASALTNAGTTLLLMDQNLDVIDFVGYTDQWYRNPSKSAGGWSLEKIDPYSFCQQSSNWIASNDITGGTPGKTNSVRTDNPDITSPALVRAGFETPSRIRLFFSEPMDPVTVTDVTNYQISNDIGNPSDIMVLSPFNQQVDLILSEAMKPGLIYTLTPSDNLADCAGNALNPKFFRVGVPQPADSLDIVINEILFNPPDRGVRYLELYNRSTKIIDLQHYTFSSKDTFDNVLTGIRNITHESLLFFPDEYMVFTPDPAIVKSHFTTTNPDGFIETTLPSMTNTRGIIALASKGQEIIDLMIYEENMQYTLLSDKKGVALERIHPDRPTLDRSNWHSAARSVGFGTPGYKNSQFAQISNTATEYFQVYPRIFSPDNDGVDDILFIDYLLEKPGFTANIAVYDSRGRLTRTLYRSELLGTTGTLAWDGITNDYQKADQGIYIIFIELFEPGGQVKSFRQTAVLAGRR